MAIVLPKPEYSPSEATLAAIGDLSLESDDDIYQHSMERYFRTDQEVFEFRAQLCTDLRTMPI